MANTDPDLYLEVEEISAELVVTKRILENILAVQERQEKALKTIAECLEKITEVIVETRDGAKGVLTIKGRY
jgi:hypothetical protein